MKFKQEESGETEDFIALLKTYKQTKNLDLRNHILMHYSYIANACAVQMRGVITGFAQVEDMVNHGVITLMDCIEKFEPDKGIRFESYAFFRVRASIIDFIRKEDWVPRRIRKMSKDIKKAYDFLSNQNLREPTDEEIAKYLGISVDILYKTYHEVSNGITVSFEAALTEHSEFGTEHKGLADFTNLPENVLLKNELKEKLMKSLDKLKEQERIVVSLHYFENLLLREIAEVLGVSESRVCQIHSKVLLKLQNSLNLYVKE